MASFTCRAFGIPIPNIIWIKNSDRTELNNTMGSITIVTTILPPSSIASTLTFHTTSKTDESAYTCVGSNGVVNNIGTPENDTVDLFVQGE